MWNVVQVKRQVCLLTLGCIVPLFAAAQIQPGPLITRPIDDDTRVTLRGNVHPLAQPLYDRGAVADSFPAARMLLILKRSPESEASLRQFIQDAHTPGSPSYHKWLTPQQFGDFYGPSDSDIASVTAWLQSSGFSVAHVSKGKAAIEFSGTAGQIRTAFHTQIHTYAVRGEVHYANASDPQIPAALAPVIAGITPMNNFPLQPNVVVLGQAGYDLRTHQVTPQWTLTSSAFALAPGDFAVQYDLNPVYNAGVNGAGVTIGIIGDSNVDPSVVASYRSAFGLPANPLNVIVDGNDPGQNGAALESYLDVEVAGAVAPGATIDLYTAGPTNVQDGLYSAAMRAVDEDVASVLSTSYGLCEKDLGSAGNQFWAAVWEQAAAQGQTSLVSSGDGGSAGCDNFALPQPAQYGLAVSGMASTPWNVAVGGTDFYYSSYNGTDTAQSAELANYWNQSPTGTQPATSLLKPVPEQPWDNPFGLNLYTGGVYDTTKFPPTIVAGSGGASSCSTGTAAADGTFSACSGGYTKPAWQTGLGVPADGVRDLPDVSLFAANGRNDSFYPICGSSKECVVSNGYLVITGVGGTSASSPAMAGILALVNQKFGRQGQANFTLYPLAAQHAAVFHDITIGSNNVPCVQGSPGCTLSTLKDNTNGIYTLGKYYAAQGYDLASGLGSVDAALLLQDWNSLTFAATDTTLTLSQTAITHGTPVTASVAVTGTGGSPSGQISLLTTSTPAINTGVGSLTLQNGSVSTSIDSLPGGQYQLTARYGGDTVFAASTSQPVTLDVSPEPSVTNLSGISYNYLNHTYGTLTSGASYPYGFYMAFDAKAVGSHAAPGSTDGVATGTMVITDSSPAGAITSGTIPVNSASIAHWVHTGFPAGTHSLVVNYSGDSSYNPSSSTPFTFTITKATTLSDTAASANRISLGANYTVYAVFGVPTSAPSPTGSVSFTLGTTALGTASLIPCNSPAEYYSYICSIHAGYSLASVSTSALPLGTPSITATYGGDSNFTSATVSRSVSVGEPLQISASATPASINQTQSFTVTATVTGISGMAAPTGTVYFDAYGQGASWNTYADIVNGSASLNFPGNAFGPGNITIDVGTPGDSVYGPATTVVTVVNLAPFTISATPLSIFPGATTGNVSTVTVTPQGGYTGGAGLSCALTSSPSGAQHLPTCIITAAVNIAGTTPATASMTITTTPPTTSKLEPPAPNGVRWLSAHGVITLAGLLVLSFPLRRRRIRSLLVLLLFLVLFGSFTACGGGAPRVTIPGTTAGNYTFTVKGVTQGISVQNTVTITVL